MQKYKFGGFDESNHGNWPELFVFLPSNNSFDIRQISRGKNRDIENIPLTERFLDAKYIVINGDNIEYKENLNKKKQGIFYSFLRVMVLSEFIRAFPGLEMIIADGEIPEKVIEVVREVTRYNGELKAQKDADIQFDIVNEADHFAYLLFMRDKALRESQHKTVGELIKRFKAKEIIPLILQPSAEIESHKITPHIEEYLPFLDLF